MKKVRQSGFELLRIVAILMIIGHHFAVHGGCGEFGQVVFADPFNNLFYNLISIGGKIGVSLFFMITAYFMFDKKVSWKSVLKNLLLTAFYVLTFYIIFSCATNSFSFVGFFKELFNFLSTYWFVKTYLIFVIVVFFFSKIIKHLNRRAHFDFCMIGFIIFSVLPALLYLGTGFYFDNLFLYFYFIFPISYIKLYVHKTNKNFLISVFAISYAVGTLMGLLAYNPNVYCENTLTNFFAALSLFLIFRDLNFKSKTINLLASATFGVYLIHDNVYVRKALWGFVYSLGQTEKSYWFVFCIAVILAIYLICTIIELFRKWLFEGVAILLKKIKKLSKKADF